MDTSIDDEVLDKISSSFQFRDFNFVEKMWRIVFLNFLNSLDQLLVFLYFRELTEIACLFLKAWACSEDFVMREELTANKVLDRKAFDRSKLKILTS